MNYLLEWYVEIYIQKLSDLPIILPPRRNKEIYEHNELFAIFLCY